MDDYISREAAINKIMANIVHQDSHDVNLHNIGLRKAMGAIDSLPAADAAEVRHGTWCVTDAYPHNVYCSECYKIFAQKHWEIWQDGSLPRDYCPSCGAIMDGGQSAERMRQEVIG